MAENVNLPAGFVVDEEESFELPQGFSVDEGPQGYQIQNPTIRRIDEFLKEDVQDYLAPIRHGIFSGFSDELAGLQGEEFAAKERERYERMGEEHPYYSAVSEIAGALVGGAGALKLLQKSAPAQFERVMKFAASSLPKAAATAAGAGGVSGALYGAGTSEDRVEGAAAGATFGGLAGPLGAVAGQAVGKGVRSLRDRAAKAFGGQEALPQKGFAELSETARMAQEAPEGFGLSGATKVQEAIQQDFPEVGAEKVLKAWSAEETPLIAAGTSNIEQVAQGAAQFAGGRQVLKNYFDKKIEEAPEFIRKSIDDNINSTNAYFATVDDVLESGKGKARPLYDRAYKASVEGIKELEDGTIQGVAPEIAQAIRRAQRLYPSKLASEPVNSIKTLDYAKRVLDDGIGKAKRAGEGSFVADRTQIKNELLSRMDKASPDYAKARAASGDYLSLADAMDSGRNFMKKDAELLRKEFNSLTEAEKTAYRVGVSKKMRDVLFTTTDNRNPSNKLIGNAEQRKRLSTILSPKQFKNLEADIKAQDQLYRMRNEVLGGSQTAQRGVAIERLKGASEGFLDTVQGGQGVVGAVTSMARSAFAGLNDKTSKQIAEILIEERPVEKLKMYRTMVGQQGLSKTERQALKEAYFELDQLFSTPEMRGALTAGMIVNY